MIMVTALLGITTAVPSPVAKAVPKCSHLDSDCKLETPGPNLTVTHRVFLEFSADGQPIGRVELGLFGAQLPKTVDNFRALCTGEQGVGKSGHKLHFAGSPMHRIIPRFMAQGGDITRGDGRGGESIYGARFPDEGFPIKHGPAGALSMANSGPDSNGSQFFITLTETPWLDGHHVVFGRVLIGMDVMQRIEKAGSPSGHPTQRVIISRSGEIHPHELAAGSGAEVH